MTAQRVLDRYLRQAAWQNVINGEYFSLRWNRVKWQLEEMADGSKIPGHISIGAEGPQMVAYEIPQLSALLSKYDLPPITYSPEIFRSGYLSLRGTPSGAEVRQQVVEAYGRFLQAVLDSFKENDSPYVEKLESLIPQFQKKLVWKPVR